MTWYYSITSSGSELKIWDHTQDPSTDTPLETLQNDGSGFTIPTDITTVMRNEAETAMNLGQGNSPVMTERAGQIIMDMMTEDIEEVE